MQENTNRNKKILLGSLAALAVLLLLFGCLALRLLHPARPNFNGQWKVRSTSTEVHTYTIDATNFRVVMYVNDNRGPRTMDVSTALDGKENPQTVFGSPATLLARWEGAKMVWEFKREAGGAQYASRRVMTMSPDGKTITTERTVLSPPPERTVAETWDRQ